MQVHTEKLRLELLDAMGAAKELAARVDSDAFRRRPADGSWSAAECIEHLSLTAETFVRRLRRVIEASKKQKPRRDETLSWLGRAYVWLLEPPVNRKLPAPSAFLPGAVAERAVLMARFERTHRELITLIEETDTFDRTRIKVATPVGKWMRISVLDSFTALAAHARRHIWQAQRALRS